MKTSTQFPGLADLHGSLIQYLTGVSRNSSYKSNDNFLPFDCTHTTSPYNCGPVGGGWILVLVLSSMLLYYSCNLLHVRTPPHDNQYHAHARFPTPPHHLLPGLSPQICSKDSVFCTPRGGGDGVCILCPAKKGKLRTAMRES